MEDFTLRNIAAAHIICDQDYTPKFFEFSMVFGAYYMDRWKYDEQVQVDGYIDPFYAAGGELSWKCDIFAYGVLLLGLITRRLPEPDRKSNRDSGYIYEWAEREYGRRIKGGNRHPSLVHRRLRSQPCFDASDGESLTKLAMDCIKFKPKDRPEIDELLERMQKLQIVRLLGRIWYPKVAEKVSTRGEEEERK